MGVDSRNYRFAPGLSPGRLLPWIVWLALRVGRCERRAVRAQKGRGQGRTAAGKCPHGVAPTNAAAGDAPLRWGGQLGVPAAVSVSEGSNAHCREAPRWAPPRATTSRIPAWSPTPPAPLRKEEPASRPAPPDALPVATVPHCQPGSLQALPGRKWLSGRSSNRSSRPRRDLERPQVRVARQ